MIRRILTVLFLLVWFTYCALAQGFLLLAGPTWLNGADIGLNFALNQYYVAGTGYVSLSSLLTLVRAGPETAQNSLGVVSPFGSNVPAITDIGLQSTWESRQNLVLNSGDLSNSGTWTTFQNNTGSISIVGNAALAPDGTNTASLVTIGRTTSNSFAEVHNVMTGTAAVYSDSIWLMAQNAGQVGKTVYVSMFDGASLVGETAITLTANWVRYVPTNGTLSTSSNCQIAIGYIGNGTATGTVGFYAWGVQVELGPTVSPYIANAGTATPRPADVYTATGSLATLLAGSSGSVAVWTTTDDAVNAAKTLIDANGTVMLGIDTGNHGTTSVGATLASSNVGMWQTVNNLGFAWDNTGGQFTLLGTTTTDAQARTPSGPFRFFSNGGTSNFWNGSIGAMLFYKTRQSAPQAVLPAGVTPGFYSRYASSTLPAGVQFRDFRGAVNVNSSNPLFTQCCSYNAFGTSNPFIKENVKSGGLYYGLTEDAVNNGSGGQLYINLSVYTGTTPFNMVPYAGNPVVTHAAGGSDNDYLSHPNIAIDCTLAPYLLFYGARNVALNSNIFLATSSDGLNYSKVGITLAGNSGAGYPNPGLPWVVTSGATKYMFLSPNLNSSTTITIFSSPLADCQTWTLVGTAFPAAVAGDWDFGAGLIDVSVTQNKQGFWEMQYTAFFSVAPQVQYIGYAIASNPAGPWTKWPTYIRAAQHKTYVGNSVLDETSTALNWTWTESDGISSSLPYGATLPPY